MHLTNYSLNKLSPNFIYNTENILDMNLGTKRTLTSVKLNMQKQGMNVDEIMEGVEDLIQKFLISMHPFLLYNFKAAFQNKTSEAKCFHILGFDILIDENGKAWILEVNSNPSLNPEHEVLGKDGKPTHELSPVDEYVK
jgi:tubulin polyglutamylase TTLL11